MNFYFDAYSMTGNETTREVQMETVNYTHNTTKFAKNLRLMRACFNTGLPLNGYHDYNKECRLAGCNPVTEVSFNKYMVVQDFGFIKERDFSRIYTLMVKYGMTLARAASHIHTILLINGSRNDM